MSVPTQWTRLGKREADTDGVAGGSGLRLGSTVVAQRREPGMMS